MSFLCLSKKCKDNSTYNLDWNSKIDIRKIYLKARFLLSKVDINGALGAKSIFIKGKYYKVPTEQLKNAEAGLITLELEEII